MTRKDVITAVEGIAKGQRAAGTARQFAGEVLTTAKRLWKFAETREWLESSCIAALTRKDFDARPRKRDVVLDFNEVAQLWRTLGDPEKCKADPVTVAALRMLILTGQREREVTDALWNEFDLEKGVWKLPAHRTKSARAHLVHLAPQAIAVLTGLQGLTGKAVMSFPRRRGRVSPCTVVV